MKKPLRKIILGICVFAVCSELAFSSEINSYNYPPFLQDDNKGVLDPLLSAVLEGSDIITSTRKYPLKRSTFFVKNKMSEFYFGGSDLLSRSFSEHYLEIPVLEFQVVPLFLKKNRKRLNVSLNKLSKSILFGIDAGLIFEDDIKKQLEDVKFFEFKTLTQAMKMLKLERVDIVSCLRISCIQTIKSLNFNQQDFQFHAQVLHRAKAVFLIRKDVPNAQKVRDKIKEIIYRTLKSQRFLDGLKTRLHPEPIPKSYLKFVN